MNTREMQRWASVSAGGLLALAGLKKGGRNGALLAFAGSALAAVAFLKLGSSHQSAFERPNKSHWQMPRERLAEDARSFSQSATADEDVVGEASTESFPASDAPSHTPTTSVGKHE